MCKGSTNFQRHHRLLKFQQPAVDHLMQVEALQVEALQMEQIARERLLGRGFKLISVSMFSVLFC